MSEPSLGEFCQIYNLEKTAIKPTCFENPKNPSCIDLMLTNKQELLFKAKTKICGLSDFHKTVVFIFRTSFNKQKPEIVTYRDDKHFNNEKFRSRLMTYFTYHMAQLKM